MRGKHAAMGGRRQSARTVLAQNLKRRRKQAGLTQAELADVAGVNAKTPSHLETAAYAATIDLLEKLARALGCDESDLLKR
jgi:transcriptional regulator with XRE-family HTH domain